MSFLGGRYKGSARDFVFSALGKQAKGSTSNILPFFFSGVWGNRPNQSTAKVPPVVFFGPRETGRQEGSARDFFRALGNRPDRSTGKVPSALFFELGTQAESVRKKRFHRQTLKNCRRSPESDPKKALMNSVGFY